MCAADRVGQMVTEEAKLNYITIKYVNISFVWSVEEFC